MALLGGGVGGAGNPVGGSFTGPAQALEIYGDFALAYSGEVGVGSAETTLLEFTSGNYLFKGWMQFQKNSFDGDDMQYQLYLNDSVVFGFTEQYGANDFADNTYPIIIPAYTVVKATATDDTGDNDRPVLIQMTGRIYRTRD